MMIAGGKNGLEVVGDDGSLTELSESSSLRGEPGETPLSPGDMTGRDEEKGELILPALSLWLGVDLA